ncbi:hypothetical protein [uncultured Methanobrevibacter sp.]|uniref:hypothetical protein n=1 Tax=uncultured Methanobrevibacter sp. TaxID=253161 RepID=UPI0025DC98E4|nr:hypothetical protein [uncultured Methanobrevibacter sp.]
MPIGLPIIFAASKGFGNNKVGNWLNKQANEWIIDDSQTKLGQNGNRDKTPKKKTGSSTPTIGSFKNNPYTLAYSVKDTPAAFSVDPSFSNTSGDISPRWPYSTDPDKQEGMLAHSLFNRYALYNFRGFYGGYSPSLADYYTDVENKSGKNRPDLVRGIDLTDVTEKKIIDYYSKYFPRIAYSPTDFLYNRYFQEIPVNYLVTLRRFSMPCEDNIFEVVSPSSSINNESNKYLATCTATTYLGEKTGNKIEDILKFNNIGLAWQELDAKLQGITAGNSTSGPGMFDNQQAGSPTFLTGLGATMANKSAASIYRTERFGGGNDPMQRYSDFVLGPVNVIDKTHIRNRGINFTNNFDLNFNYELKSWYMVNPKIAMLDLFSNMLVMTTNNGAFWGGGWRYTGGQSKSLITDLYGDRSKLRSGDFIGYAQSVVSDVVHGNPSKNIKGITGLFGDGSGSFSFKSILNGVKDILQNILTQRIGNLLDQFSGGQTNPGSEVPNALLSSEPTGYWHVTIGNPLNPIAIMGNMILEDCDFVLGGGLGYDDFPMEFNVTVKLKHGKPRDRSDIENMFNMGHGRIYAAPAVDDDILNIAGKEIQEYGVYATGPGMHTFIKTVSKNNSMSENHVANIISMNILD